MSTISSPRPHPWERLCCGRAFPAPISISIANPTNSTPSSSTALCRPSPIRALCASRPDLGTIPRVVADAREIYASRLTLEEGLRRIDSLYKPYHAALRGLMERAAARFGVAVLIDCHSMPSTGARDPLLSTRGDKRRIDFVIGDRYGAERLHRTRRRRRGSIARPRLSRHAQSALRGRFHHRALRQARRPAGTRCRSKCRVVFTWTSRRSRRTSASTPSPAILRTSWRWWRGIEDLSEILGGERRAAAE